MLANQEVVKRFLRRERGTAAHLRSDGESLWSYWTKIGWWEGDELVCRVGLYSFTTSQHQRLLWREAKGRFWPVAGESPPTVQEMREAAMVVAVRCPGCYYSIVYRHDGESEETLLPAGVADAVLGGRKTVLLQEPLATYLLAYMRTGNRRLARAIRSRDIERMRRAFILLSFLGVR